MLSRPLAVAALLLVVAPAAAGAAPCPVEPLPDEVLQSGDAAVERYRELRRLQFTPELMGYRDGPALGPPSRKERRAIRRALRFRRTFGLNTKRLLIRRLLRDHSLAVRRTKWDFGTPLTSLEKRDFAFRTRVETTGPINRYLELCAHRVSGGIHIDQGHPSGLRIVASVVAGLERHREALSRRYKYRALVRVRLVRFTERHLQALMDRLNPDLNELERSGVDVDSAGLSISHNRVFVEVEGLTRRERRLLRRRYGPALVPYPARRSGSPYLRARGGSGSAACRRGGRGC
jgi:hypothetical protein